jgi:radical SAM protein with 4Fe4S-binding SPASM domain
VRFSLHGITLDEMKSYYQNRPTLERYFCKAPWSTMLLSPKGQVMPCYYTPVGSVREHSVRELWNGWAAREFRRQIQDKKFLPGCVGCCNGQFGAGKAEPAFS